MPFKLAIRPLISTESEEPFESSYHQEVVTIGRGEFNDLRLRDKRKLVSSRHAEIHERGTKFFLVDVGSKNGTQLNKQELISGKEYSLGQEDEISIGDFIVQFYPVVAEKEHSNSEWKDSSTFVSDITHEIRELLENINRVYSENIHEDAEMRKSLLEITLSDALKGMNQGTVERMIDLVEARYPEPEYQQKRILKSPPREEVQASAQESEVHRVAYQGVLDIARTYLNDLDSLKDSEKLADFIRRIDTTLKVVLGSLVAALKGRRQFEEEFDVRATQILAWKPNPIKLAGEDHEIGNYLFDAENKKESAEEVAADLREVFTDLALHQMGLMAGLKECIRGLLDELDPEQLEARSRAGFLKDSSLKRLFAFSPVVVWSAWNRFREKHKELLEEEVRTFEKVLFPRFAKGYLSVQKKKRTH